MYYEYAISGGFNNIIALLTLTVEVILQINKSYLEIILTYTLRSFYYDENNDISNYQSGIE